MKTGTLLRLFFILIFLGACSRNPLGEDLKQPILNLAFFLTQSCNNSPNQDSTYNCQITTNEVVATVTYTLDPLLTTCTWATINATSGVISGTPNDNQVGVCQMVVNATNSIRSSPTYTYTVQVINLASSLSIANAANIFEDDPATVIRNDAAVQAGEEGFGLYSFDNANTTAPACSTNSSVLTIDANTGAVTFAPALNYTGTCNIRVAFDDGNGAANSIVTSEFSITVIGINDAPVLNPIAAQTTPEDTPLLVNFTVSDPDDILTCAGSMSATTTDATIVPAASVVFSGIVPNCTATITPVANANGILNLTFTVTDTGVPVMTASQSFALNVTAVNDPPVMAVIAPQTTAEDTPIAVNFTISDVDSAVTCAGSVTAATSDPTIVTVPNIIFSGIAPNCIATISPLANANGLLNLTFTVSDGGVPLGTAAQTFALTVTPVNDVPTISAIAAQTTAEDTPLAVNFTINDIDSVLTCTGSVTATTSDPTIVPVPNIIFSGTAPNCTATLAPLADANGLLNLTFTVADGGVPVQSASQSFALTVTPVNDIPVMSAIAAQTTSEDTPIAVNFTINDVDSALTCAGSVTAATSDPTIVTVPNVVFTGVAPNCTATITPLADANGLLNLTFTVADGGAPVQSASQSFALTVTPVNDIPVISAIAAQTTAEDTPLAVNFTISDIDSALTCASSVTATTTDASIVTVPNVIFSGVVPNCTATITPQADANGLLNLTFTVSDGGVPVQSASQSFALTVTPVNDLPTISVIAAQTTTEDAPLAVNFTINDIDSVLTCAGSVAAATSDPTIVTVPNVIFSGIAPNCTATITPLADANGLLNLTFTVSDGGAPVQSASQTFALTVTPLNDPPVMPAIAAQTGSEDGFFTVNFTVTDVDNALNCGTSITATTSDPTIITVPNIVFGGVIPNCTATVTSEADANGLLNLTFTANDGSGGTASQTFNVTITPVNDAPVLSVIGAQSTPENSFLTVNFTVTDIDSLVSCSNVNFSATSSNPALMPVAAIVFGGAVPNCTVTFTPAPNTFGASNIVITVDDNGIPNLQDTEAFVLTVTPFNDPPIMSAIGAQTTLEDNSVAVNFTINDVDNVLDCTTSLSATTSDPTIVTVPGVLFSGVAPNCTATITPVGNATGVVNLTFIVADTGIPIKTDSQTFALTVTPDNDPPVISAIGAQSTVEDTQITVNFTINDVDNAVTCAGSVSAATSDASIVTVPSIAFGGTAPNCTATFTPQLNANGLLNLTFTVTDGSLSDSANFNLTVTPFNDPPVISAIAAQTTAEDTQLAVNFTISDVDSAVTCGASVSAATSNSAIVTVPSIVFSGVAPNCTATFTPQADANGSLNLTFTVSDGSLSAASVFNLTVTPVNDPPLISAIAAQTTAEDTPLTINFTISDVDDTLNCSTSMSASTSNAAIIPVAGILFGGVAPNCTATVTPVLNANGAMNLTFTVTDGGALSANRNFNVTVTPVDDPPVISAIGAQTTSEDNFFTVNFTILDVDSPMNCGTSVSASTTNAAIIPAGNVLFSGVAPNCVATITPAPDANGSLSLTLTVTDGTTPVGSTFNVTVTAVDDPPLISAIAPQTTAEDTLIAVNFTISDVDSTLTCAGSMSAASNNTAVVAVAGVSFSGTIPNCTATINPVANAFGVATLDLTVTDGTTPVTSSFNLTVTPVNDAPVLSFIGAQSTNEDTQLVINFSITDVDDVMDCTTSVVAGSSNPGIVPTANVLFGGLAPNCTATINPVPNANGPLNLTFTVSDGLLNDFETFALTVTADNDAPIISAIGAQTTAEDTQLVVNFTINDVDNILDCSTSMSASTTNAAIVTSGSVLFGGVAPNCTATFTPQLNANGSLNLSFIVTDGSLPVTSTFNLNVTAVNDAPTISAIAPQTTAEDTQFAVNFTINDVDNTLTCAGSVSAATSDALIITAGSVVITGTAPNCTATINPVPDANGALTLTLTVTDGALPAAQAFAVTVNAVNDAPIISTVGSPSTNEDTALPIVFSITDVDSVLDCTTSMSASTSNAGVVALAGIAFSGAAPNCTVTITPVPDANGTVNLSMTVTDGGGLFDTENFTLTVNPQNDAPILSAIGNQTVAEDGTKIINFTINDIDSTLNCITSLNAGTSDMTLVPVANIVFSGTAPNCTVTISPVLNANGILNLTFSLTDTIDTDFETFQLTITPVNDPPVISAIAPQTINEDDPPLAVNFTISDVDDVLDCTTSMSAASNNLSLVPVANVAFSGAAPNCTATVTSLPNANGVVTLTLTATDGTNNPQRSFNLTVNAVNDPPTFTGIIAGQAVNEDNQLVVNFVIDDIDSVLSCNTAMSASSSTPALIDATGIVFGGAYPNCTATFTPQLNQNGAANLTFRVSDAQPLFSDQTFMVTVNPVNDAPTITDIVDLAVNEDTPTAALPFTIGDVDSVLLCSSANVTLTSSNVALVPDANLVIGGAFPNCTLTATPLANLSGATTITMTVNDNAAPNLQASQTFVLTVNAVNDPPTVSTVANLSTNEETATGPLAFTIADIETGGALTCAGSVTATSSNQVIIPNGSITIGGVAPNCTVDATPALDKFGGPVTITLTVTDTGTPLPAQTGTSTFDITVINVNDAPVLVTVIADQVTNEDVPVVVNFVISDTDNVLSCGTAVTAASTNGALVPVGSIVFGGTYPNCTATVTSSLNQFGVSTLTFTVSDGALSDSKSFLYTVNDVDQTPVMSVISNYTLNEDNSATPTQTPVPLVINFTITDSDSTLFCNSTYLSASSTNAALIPAANVVFAGTAPNCTATVTLVANATGTATLTFTVTDLNSSSSRNSNFTVSQVNDLPTISSIADQTTDKNVPITVNFTIADNEETLTCVLFPGGSLSRGSSSGTILPTANIVFGGTAPNCTATLTPANNQVGLVAFVTMQVRDGVAGHATQSTQFSLRVNDPPVISAIGNQSFPANTPTDINFTITDTNNTLDCITSMSVTSSDQVVVPTANVVFSGTAPNCKATVTAITTGTSNLVFTVTDGRVPVSSSSTVTSLNAGTVVVSQSFSTATVTANSSLESSRAYAKMGEVSTIKVTVRDTSQNVLGGGHWVLIQRGTGTSNGTLSAVTDHGDGTYTATFTGNTAGTARTFNAFIDGYPITSPLPAVTVSNIGPNCLSYKNSGSNSSGVYTLDADGDSGPSATYTAYCDMVTQGGGWTLAAIPRKGIAPFAEAAGLLSPGILTNSRNASVWSANSTFEFTQLRVTEDATAAVYSIANFNASQTMSSLLVAHSAYSQSNVVAGVTVNSSIGSGCFIVRGKSGNYGLWDDRADFMFLGFHGGSGCTTPLSDENFWDSANITQQWLISGYDGLDAVDGPEGVNNSVGQNMSGAPWVSQDNPTIIWFK